MLKFNRTDRNVQGDVEINLNTSYVKVQSQIS